MRPQPAGPSMLPLRLHERAGSPRELCGDPPVCLNETLKMGTPADEPAAAASTTELPLGTTLQRYILLECVGQGAMGVIYAAYDYELDRKVALKLLREPSNSAIQRRRFKREAQALARLSHPNVVAVHDLGSYGDQVFIAMEYVAGRTLRRWLEEEPRSLHDVLAVYRAAGEGLAAAHAAGIVHRDFKPDNVLVDLYGRARVSDFGLASVSHDYEELLDAPAHESVESEPPESGALTRTGMLFGTPAYMALEQHLGQRRIDARADQFSFAVALYESVCGVHPFEAAPPAKIADNIRHGRIQKPRRRVPGWLVRALLPALAADPARRYPSMDALLRKLRDRRRRHFAAALAAVLLVVAVGVGVGVGISRGLLAVSGDAERPDFSLQGQAIDDDRPPVCRGTAGKLDGVWDPARKEQIKRAFLTTRSPLAQQTWNQVERELDRYADSWRRLRTDVCEAAHQRQDQAEAPRHLALQIECLEVRKSGLRELGNELLKVGPERIEKAALAPSSLRPLDRCADVEALKTEVSPPDEAAPESLRQLHDRDAQLRAALATGRFEKEVAASRKLVADATALRHPPAQAQALLTLGELLWARNDLDGAGNALARAFVAAQAGRTPWLQVEALLRLAGVVGAEQGRYAHGLVYLELARRELEGMQGELSLKALAEDTEGVLRLHLGQLAQASTQLKNGLYLYKQAHGPNSHQTSVSLDHLGMLALAEHRITDAVRLFGEARQIAEALYGLEHSVTLTYLAHEARALAQAGQLDKSFATNKRGRELSHAEDATGVMFLTNLGLIEAQRKQYPQAREHLTQALAITVKLHGREHVLAAEAATDLGRVLVEMGRAAEARPQLTRAAAIFERRLGADHPELANALLLLGRAHMAVGQPALAVPLLERALKIQERAEAPAAKRDEIRQFLKHARARRAS